MSAVNRFLVCLNLVTLKRFGNRLKTSLLCSSVGLAKSGIPELSWRHAK